MNMNTPIKETDPDVVIALIIFLICVFIALYFDSGSLVSTFVLAN